MSVDPRLYKGGFSDDLFWLTFYIQHLGESNCGLAVAKNARLRWDTKPGLLRHVFGERFGQFDGDEGIGYCGPTAEPIHVYSRFGELVVCFSGNISNREALLAKLMQEGIPFEKGDDVEVITSLIVRTNYKIVDSIKAMAGLVQGAYSLVILSEHGIYAICSPEGHWPLVIGKKEGALVVSSESAGFFNRGFKLIRDVEPGEILLIKDAREEVLGKMNGRGSKFCSFYLVYTSFASAVLRGRPASLIRKNLGGVLARRDIQRGFIPDVVIPVPDSGRFHAIGYHQEYCRAICRGAISRIPLYDEGLLKYPHAGRSFTPQSGEARRLMAHVKILPGGEDWTGLVVVVCDDSIVRGTQTQEDLIPKLRSLGVKKIHLRISEPELLDYCPYGKTTKKGELLAQRFPEIADRVRFLGVDSLEYNTIDDLVSVIGIPSEQLCLDCNIRH